jgi:hypothetical protein
MAPGRDIAAAALDGDHAVADREAGNPAGDMQVLQAFPLLLCEEADLLRGKADGLERIRIDFFVGLLHLLRGDADRRAVEVVEFRGVIGERLVAARLHLLDDVGYRPGQGGIAFIGFLFCLLDDFHEKDLLGRVFFRTGSV